MNIMKNLIKTTIFFAMVFFLFPRAAYCYIDPGTGSFVLQILIAAFLGVAYSIKLFWKKILLLLSFLKVLILSKVT